jgi:ABC-type nitrate/sulfonate/bicarbonate transport system substrate-binding protein
MRRRRFDIVIGSLMVAHALLSNVAAQDKPLKKVYFGVSTLSPNLIFEKNGLDVETVLLRGSRQTSQAMVSGSLFASSVASPAVMLANRRDVSVRLNSYHCGISSPLTTHLADKVFKR